MKDLDLYSLDFDRIDSLQDLMGEAMARLVLQRLRSLEVSPGARKTASESVSAANVRGLDETRLWLEWRNDLLARKKGCERYKEAARDPSADYRKWIAWRVGNPFHVSYRALDRAIRRVGVEKANLMRHVRWHQEIAWAQRFRGSADDATAFIAHSFVLAAVQNPSQEFVKLIDTMGQVTDDRAYVLASEHEYNADQIRFGYGSAEFVPLFLHQRRVSMEESLSQLDDRKLRAGADMARKIEVGEQGRILAQRVAGVARESCMSRLTGVISTAIEVGLSSDKLMDAQDEFIGLIESGKIPVNKQTGVPFVEFMAWLRTERHSNVEIFQPLDDVVGEAELLDIVTRPVQWVSNLPEDYRTMMGGNPKVFHEWLSPLARRERRFPKDPVTDYGFHLVSMNYRLPA